MDEPTVEPNEVTTPIAGESPGEQKRPWSERFRPGFPWGLATGAIVVVLIVAASIGISQLLVLQRFSQFSSSSGLSGDRVVVSPVEAGKPWFSIPSTGRGTLEAWSAGGSSSGGDSGPDGAIGEIDVGAIGVVDGVTVKHTVQVYLTPRTMVFIGNQAYSKGKSSSVASAILGAEGPSDVLSGRLLTIEFHRVGKAIVADKISAPLEAGSNPLQY